MQALHALIVHDLYSICCAAHGMCEHHHAAARPTFLPLSKYEETGLAADLAIIEPVGGGCIDVSGWR
jgi:hypothetical protein